MTAVTHCSNHSHARDAWLGMATQQAVQRHIHLATLRILRGHDFSRTSSNAVSVLVDLVSRFFDLVATSTAEHANFAGRDSANVYDVLQAFEELGIDLDEMLEWCRRDAPALDQYAPTIPQPPFAGKCRVIFMVLTVLNRTSDAIKVGTVPIDETPIVWEYRPVEDDEELPDSPYSETLASPTLIPSLLDWDMDGGSRSIPSSPESDAFTPGPSGSVPLSKMDAWNSLVSHHPHDHLPPFPGDVDDDMADGGAYPEISELTIHDQNPPVQTSPVKLARRPTRTNAAVQTPLYDDPRPFEESTSGNELFDQLPEPPSREGIITPPPTHPFLLIAMQTAQENSNVGSNNPSRLAISSTLSAAATTRYTASNSLFSASQPPPPRNLAPAPTHAIPQIPSVVTMLLPPPQPRSIQSSLSDSLDPQPLHLRSHMQALAERVVKPGVQERSTMLVPPPPFFDPQDQTPYLYGRPSKAPWNKPTGQQTRGDRPSGLTDALLYNTWPTVQKVPEEELKGKG